MIISTLANIPGFGANPYGGFVTYNTDAKRKFINVRKDDVNSEEAARQMALGALKFSRAMVSIAVTGHAGPVGDAQDLGVVDAAVYIRSKENSGNNYVNKYRRFFFCDGDGQAMTTIVCRKYRQAAKASQFLRLSLLSATRKAIRQNVVISVLSMAIEFLDDFFDEGMLNPLSSLGQESYDGRYPDEPTSVVPKYMTPNRLS